ncbi:MAG: hypothetical protein JKY37_04115 [Nannocystaceae bacterium]|nr:hypothetical protein [Nannocystaceae bacterium]
MRTANVILGLFLSIPLWGCEPTTASGPPKAKALDAGGVYIAYNHGCEQGCSDIGKGDLIQKIDGKVVKTSADFDAANLTDGKPHKLNLLAAGSLAPKQTEIVAKPYGKLPPLENVPPFWAVGAEELNAAPSWARKRMFGHASPSVMLVNSDGGILDGRQLAGKQRMLVYWDHGDRTEQAQAVTFLQVLQKAQKDLLDPAKNGVTEVMMVQVRFPTGRQVAMNDSDIRAWQKKFGVKEGGLAPLPMFRFPNKTEFNSARELGMENAFTVFENLGKSPSIVILDDRGIVRWHSEGIQEAPAGSEAPDGTQCTIIEAVNFCLNDL